MSRKAVRSTPSCSGFWAKRFPDKTVRIFNLGSGAWKSIQELIAIVRYGLDIRPDLIIAFDGFNDIEHSFSTPVGTPYAGWRMEEAFNRYADWVLGGPGTSFQGLRIIQDLRERASRDWSFGLLRRAKATDRYPAVAVAPVAGKLSTRVELPIDKERIAQRTDFDPYNRETVNFYLRNMMLMGRIAQAGGSQILHVLQPAFYLKDQWSAVEKTFFDGYEREINYVVQGYGRISAGLEQQVKDTGIGRFLDLSAPFQGDSTTYFLDYAHMNPAGYRIVAAKVADAVGDMLRSKKSD